jgi:DNA-binding CsgD family transcriptional regulator
MFTFDGEQRVRSWNRAAEELTGLAAEDAIGRPCWEVICAHDDAGHVICHTGCSFHRLLRERWPVSPPTLMIRTATGRRRVQVPMVTIEDGELFAAVMVEATAPAETAPVVVEDDPPPDLTTRQATVLAMLADGKPARVIAAELQLSEMTVRNHIRAVLRALECNSQLAAVAKARRVGLV